MDPDSLTKLIVPQIYVLIGIALLFLTVIVIFLMSRSSSKAYRAEGAKAGKEAARELLETHNKLVEDLRCQLENSEWRNKELGDNFKAALMRLEVSEDILRSAKLALNVAIEDKAQNLVRIIQLEKALALMQQEIEEIKRTSSERINSLKEENVQLRAELEAQKKVYEEARLRWEIEREELQREIEDLKMTLDTLRNGMG